MAPRLRERPALLAAALLAAAAPAAGAQHAAALRTGAAPAPLAGAPPQPAVPRSEYPSAWRYAGTGALIGGTAAAVALGVAAYQARNTECMICTPLLIPPVLVSGAALGAAAGYVVHRVRYH